MDAASPVNEIRATEYQNPLTQSKIAQQPEHFFPKVLSLACVYPSPIAPGNGLFIERRLQNLAQLVPLNVLAPFSIFHYGGMPGRRFRFRNQCPNSRKDGNFIVFYPRWFYPPFAGSLNACFLALAVLRPIARLRKEFTFDIIDTHFGHPEGVAGLLLSLALGVPFTMTFRGNEPRHGAAGLGRRLMRLAAQRAIRIFTVSERLRQFAIGLGADPNRVKTIPNGVDTNVFFPRDRAQIRVRHGLPLDRPMILSAGALVERKGHHRIVEAMASMSISGVVPYLVIAGGPGPEGRYEETIRALVSKLGLHESVHFLGQVPPQQLAELMSAADVFCLSSTNEGWPNVVHEALACGTPVVATDVGAVPDMLPSNRYGYVVPVNDRAALREALQKALESDWDRSAISAWGKARSWNQVALEVFTELKQAVIEQRNSGAHKTVDA